MSLLGYKQTSRGLRQYVRLSPNKRHSLADVRYRADFVRLYEAFSVKVVLVCVA